MHHRPGMPEKHLLGPRSHAESRPVRSIATAAVVHDASLMDPYKGWTFIDQAAEIVGANRLQFIMTSALKEAKDLLLEQSTIYADAKAFQTIMDWLDTSTIQNETDGMKRILHAKAPWPRA